MLADHTREPNLHDFAYGSTWGSGISAGVLGAAGLYGKTSPEAKGQLGKYFPNTAPAGTKTAGQIATGSEAPPGHTFRPTGLLGILTAAGRHGYK